MSPYLRGTILEIGAGHGTIAERLARHGQVVASEISARSVERLAARFAGDSRIEVVRGDLAAAVRGRRFDAVVLVNVLEHVPDDQVALRDLQDCLGPDGHLLVFVPAMPALMSRFDRAVGHQHRYGRGALIAAAYRAGLEVVDARYVNACGALGWWLVATKLQRVPTTDFWVKVYDAAIIPWVSRLERLIPPPFGQSLLLIAKRPPVATTPVTAARRA